VLIKDLISLSKPGIIFGNLIALIGGHFLATKGQFDPLSFWGSLIGIALIIGSAGVINNIFDRDIDKLMDRTQKRALVRGVIALRSAYLFGFFLAIIGIAVLALTTNFLTLLLALGGLFIYLVLYTLLLKRNSIHATLIGGLSGAVPPAVGYCAVTNHFDMAALLLVFALCFWQMPHAYAIAIFHAKDFNKANLPLFPLIKSADRSKLAMFIYGVLFLSVAMLFPIFSYVGILFTYVVGSCSFFWLALLLQGFWVKDDVRWAKRVFACSILVIVSFSLSFIWAFPDSHYF